MKTRIARLAALTVLAALWAVPAAAQQPGAKDKPVFSPEKDATYDAIKAARKKADEPEKAKMWLDFATVKAPAAPEEFQSVWRFPPLRQGISGMCWCFCTTSLLESEIKRLSGREIKLSEMHTVYWEYVEKAREFVRTRGESLFDQGSQGAAVLRAWRNHGVVPGAAYTGLPKERKDHDHTVDLFREMKAYLAGVKAAGAWNEEAVVSTVRSILDFHLGRPPATVDVDGKKLTPPEYLQQVVKLNLDDYVELVSFLDRPYWERVEYDVPDNWWHGKEYLNIPLDDFLAAFRKAVREGYSLAVAADMSEAGYSIGAPGVAVVPDFDIPPTLIDERARQFRFDNGSTTDDHGLHVVGWLNRDGQDWYLVKDSWSSAWNNGHPGYYFFREDYVKLKVLGFLVHKDAVRDLLAREKKPGD